MTEKGSRQNHGELIAEKLHVAGDLPQGILSVGTATIFPQDPWESPPTFAGEMHIILSGILSIITIISMGLIGAWFNKIGLMTHFWKFTWVIVGLTILSAGFYVSNLSTPIMGLTERITIIIGFSWTFILAQWLSRSTGTTNGQNPTKSVNPPLQGSTSLEEAKILTHDG